MSRSSEIMALQRRVAELSRRLDNRPILGYQAPQSKYSIVRIVYGQTLGTGQTGIKYSTTPITSVPSAYNADTDTSFIDGIGSGQMYQENIGKGNVILLNDTTSVIGRVLLAGDWVSVLGPVDMPAPGGNISVYRVWFL